MFLMWQVDSSAVPAGPSQVSLSTSFPTEQPSACSHCTSFTPGLVSSWLGLLLEDWEPRGLKTCLTFLLLNPSLLCACLCCGGSFPSLSCFFFFFPSDLEELDRAVGRFSYSASSLFVLIVCVCDSQSLTHARTLYELSAIKWICHLIVSLTNFLWILKRTRAWNSGNTWNLRMQPEWGRRGGRTWKCRLDLILPSFLPRGPPPAPPLFQPAVFTAPPSPAVRPLPGPSTNQSPFWEALIASLSPRERRI